MAKRAESGVPSAAVACRHGINESMIYNQHAVVSRSYDDFVPLQVPMSEVGPAELKAHSFAHHILPKYSEVSSILNVFDQHPECHLSTLSEALPLSSIRLEITLSWLLKVGTLSLER
mgnify:CR=1 FL=1